jgi:histidinol-phosphatase
MSPTDGRAGRAGHSDDLALALALADTADAVTLPRFRAADLRVERKPDRTPVTDADTACEDRLRSVIADHRPDDTVLGEERGGELGAGRVWVLDPIDGTKNFSRGVPVWATLIGLMVDGEVVVGVVSAPLLNRRWWAMRDGGAWTGKSLLRATQCQVSDVSRIEDASLSYASLGGWDERGRLDDFLSLSRRCWRTRAYGDFWSYMLVAEGAVDLAAEPELALHDMAALDVIVREAGGVFTSLEGEPGPNGGSALASNGKLHDQALAFLGSVDEAAKHAQRGGGSVHDLAERRRLTEELPAGPLNPGD